MTMVMLLLLVASAECLLSEDAAEAFLRMSERGVTVEHSHVQARAFPPRWIGAPFHTKGTQMSCGEVERIAPILERFSLAYGGSLGANLRTVHLLGGLWVSGVSIAATSSKDAIYIKSTGVEDGFTDAFLLGRLHSEFSSILMRNGTFPKEAWAEVNPRSFEYMGNGLSIASNQGLYKTSPALWKEGFLVSYSVSSLENDFNMVADWLAVQPDALSEVCRRHDRIGAKVRLAAQFYSSMGIDVAIPKKCTTVAVVGGRATTDWP